MAAIGQEKITSKWRTKLDLTRGSFLDSSLYVNHRLTQHQSAIPTVPSTTSNLHDGVPTHSGSHAALQRRHPRIPRRKCPRLQCASTARTRQDRLWRVRARGGMPLLLNRPGAPLPCREQPAEFETVNGHFSAQMHAFFNALHDLEDMADKPSSDDLDLCRPDECPRPVICVSNQSEPYLDCLHRTFYTRCLTVQNPDSLPCLKRVTHTQLRILPDRDPTFHLINIRPVSLRIPLDLATYLPQLRELACPWL